MYDHCRCRVRIPELLNQLCNESQGSDTVRRDACYGCFFRASSQTVGYPLLVALSNCADMYLNNTDYGHCQQYLRVSSRTILYRFFTSSRSITRNRLFRKSSNFRKWSYICVAERHQHDKFKNESYEGILHVPRMCSTSEQGQFSEFNFPLFSKRFNHFS